MLGLSLLHNIEISFVVILSMQDDAMALQSQDCRAECCNRLPCMQARHCHVAEYDQVLKVNGLDISKIPYCFCDFIHSEQSLYMG